MGGCSWLLLELAFFLGERGTYVGADTWLSVWASASDATVPTNGFYRTIGFGPVGSFDDTRRYMIVWAILIGCNAFFAFARTAWFVQGGARAAEAIFVRLLHGIVRSPMAFFDTTPVGRLTARLAYDTEILDGLLVQKGLTVMASIWWLISGLSVILSIVPFVAVALLPCGLIYTTFHLMYLRSGVQIQRLFAQSQSPLVSHIEESLAGGATIRSFGQTGRFRSRLMVLNDDASAAFVAFVAVGRWLAVRLEVIGAIVSFAVALACWSLRDALSGSLAGLAIIWSFNLTITLNFFVLSTSEFESKGVSLERCLEFAKLAPEAPLHTDSDTRLAPDWPQHGALEFRAVTLRYRPSLPPALNGFSYACAAGTHTGIIGRSGAGKSTIASALFRLVELSSGSIFIDGVDLANLGLAEVRSRALAIIPQEPLLFKGALRRSLDPLHVHTDDKLWDALRTVDMERAVLGAGRDGRDRGAQDGAKDGGSDRGALQALSDEGGANWSVGERQLLCFARALLRTPRVLVLDEATASVDHAADERIQRAIRTTMRSTTLLTIAHRLQTVLDYDAIICMRAGRCIEAGAPHELLQAPDSALSAVVSSLGAETADRLRAIAKRAAEEKKGQ
jgi:ABC-type multidrug transport system fused ATPase/permease subunit